MNTKTISQKMQDFEQEKLILNGKAFPLNFSDEWMSQIVIRYFSAEFYNAIVFPAKTNQIKEGESTYPISYKYVPQHVTLGHFKGTRKQFLIMCFDLIDLLRSVTFTDWHSFSNIDSNEEGYDLIAFEVEARSNIIQEQVFSYINKKIRKQSMPISGKTIKQYIPHISYGYVPEGNGNHAINYLMDNFDFESVKLEKLFLYVDQIF